MGLSLVVGPAHAGKIERLLERFVAVLDRDPWFVVPNRVDVEQVERELVERSGGLLAGAIGTFDTLFEHLAHGDGRGGSHSSHAVQAAPAIAAGHHRRVVTTLESAVGNGAASLYRRGAGRRRRSRHADPHLVRDRAQAAGVGGGGPHVVGPGSHRPSV